MTTPPTREDKDRPDYWLRFATDYVVPLKGGRACKKCGNPHLKTQKGVLYCERCGPQEGPR